MTDLNALVLYRMLRDPRGPKEEHRMEKADNHPDSRGSERRAMMDLCTCDSGLFSVGSTASCFAGGYVLGGKGCALA
jgi:hypothetical protein